MNFSNFFRSLFQKLPNNSLQNVWMEQGQKIELEYHITSEWRRSGDFMPQTMELFEAFGFKKDDYNGKTILDLGAGSQLRTKYFTGAKIIALEPLADKYIEEVALCDLHLASQVFSVPAEKTIDTIKNSSDFCISINVLDHCYNFKAIIENIYTYLKKDGTAFLSFDSHAGITDPAHPLSLTQEECTQIFIDTGFFIKRVTKGFPESFAKLISAHSYGHGEYCLNFWLSKP
ncbi:methyltransferase domain-containing protein [Desulfovibrio cuneatus]|uniref:methyltransferase domain-containing protein n=1 Tax=Desulfovibrio cuneatus TaxID=159728 RepID=UPI00146FB485|nr:class I SAM-dependent methyltransferase [Desulfovibrio cuneatus]